MRIAKPAHIRLTARRHHARRAPRGVHHIDYPSASSARRSDDDPLTNGRSISALGSSCAVRARKRSRAGVRGRLSPPPGECRDPTQNARVGQAGALAGVRGRILPVRGRASRLSPARRRRVPASRPARAHRGRAWPRRLRRPCARPVDRSRRVLCVLVPGACQAPSVCGASAAASAAARIACVGMRPLATS